MAEIYDPAHLPDAARLFLSERHLATFTTTRSGGQPQVTPVGFTYDERTQVARVITWADSWKTKHVLRDPSQVVGLCQVDGGRWLSLYGTATASLDPDRTAEGVRRYTDRYRQPKERTDRVVIEIAITRIVGRAG